MGIPIKGFAMDNPTFFDPKWNELIEKARSVRSTAYAPYSRFQVGAALLCRDGKIYSGVNVENASYGLTICAERNAVAKAVSEGEREFTAIAIAGPGPSPVTPCGACRQVLAEFGRDLAVIMAGDESVEVRKIEELLPEAFGKKPVWGIP
jgi:cytidine deaminase